MNSNEDYAQYIIQKHIVAIAIAVIKTRPANLTLETYIDNIRERINENMDRNINVIIREEDFHLSSDDDDNDAQLNNSQGSVNILNNIDLNDFDDPPKGKDVNAIIEVLNNIQEDSVNETNCTQSTYFNESQKPMNIVTHNVDEIAHNIREFCENYNKNETNVKPSNNMKEVINNEIFNKTNHNVINKNDRCKLVSKYLNANNKSSSGSHMNQGVNNKINIENDNTDSQQTMLYTLKGFTCNTHVSQSQDNVVVTNEKLLQTSHNVGNNTTCNENVKENIENNEKLVQIEKNNSVDNNIYADPIELDCETQNMYTEEDFQEFYANNIEIHDKHINETEKIDDSVNFAMSDKQVGSKKHKNDQNENFSDVKRKKIDTNEIEIIKNSRFHPEVDEIWPFSDASTPAKLGGDSDTEIFSPSPKCCINNTRNEFSEIDFEENPDQNLDIFTQNIDSVVLDADENLAIDSLMQMDKFSNHSNDLTPNINQDRHHFNERKGLFEKNTALQIKTTQSFEESSPGMKFQSYYVSHENTYKKSLEYVKTNEEYELTKSTFKETDKNCTLVDNINPYIEDNSVFDEPFINLSQNVRNFANYKRKEDVSKSNLKTESKEFSKNTYTDTKESAYSKERLNERILNNSAYLQHDTEVNCHDNKIMKEFTSVLPNQTDEAISDQNERTKERISNENTQTVGETENSISENSEIVSFKIYEELNKIKSYLNRKERIFSQSNSSDSGFKSSQPRSSYKSASPHSEVRINQSAHCLLSFMSIGQLSDQTTDIADEVSKTLGKLVDRLHEEEKYPNFLEELLDRVSALLKQLYEGNNAEEYVLFKREDTIDRLLLLNRSAHIINFTIEKIIIILENLHSELEKDILLELENIDKAENIGHIFDILEILIKRSKKSNELSQLSQISIQDDDRMLKKSSLTEIWKRKWNLIGNEIREGSTKKKCVLTKCGEVLNKIIVKAMDGYSLISFAALQCFNLLQN